MMKMTSLFWLAAAAIVTIVVFTQCKSTATTATTPPNTPAADAKLIAMHTGPCFGTCPVYTITVHRNGLVEYQGDRFTNKAGLWSLQLEQTELDKLQQMIKEADLLAMQDQYESRIPDLAMVTITYHAGEKIKTIKGREDRPEGLMKIEKMLKALATSKDWKLIKAPDYGLAENEIPNEIIVQLKDEITVEEFLESQQSRFSQLTVKERVAPNLNYWVITYDPTVMGPKNLLTQFKNSEMVVNASFNKTVEMRE